MSPFERSVLIACAFLSTACLYGTCLAAWRIYSLLEHHLVRL